MHITIKILVFLALVPTTGFALQRHDDALSANHPEIIAAQNSEKWSFSLFQPIGNTLGWIGDKAIGGSVRHCAGWVWDTDYTVGTRMRRFCALPCFGVALWQTIKAARSIRKSWKKTEIGEVGSIAKPAMYALGAGLVGFIFINEPTKISRI